MNETINQVNKRKDFGHIELRLREYMELRGVNRNQLALASGTRYEVIDRWYSGNIARIDIDVLARVCFVLSCNIDDILVYVPEGTDPEST